MLQADTLEKLRHAYQEWHDTRGKSVATWLALLADDVELKSVADGAPGMEFSATRKGRSDAQGYFSALAADWEMIFHRADEFLVDGDRVVVFGRCAFRHKRTGKTVESPVVHRWRFRDGEATEYFEFYDTARAFAAATPDPK